MLSVNDFHSCCRVCGNNKGICINLLASSENDYLNKVQSLLPIKIETNDNLPKNLCHVCIAKITAFHNLRENCIKIQTTFNVIALTFNENPERETISSSSFAASDNSTRNSLPSKRKTDENEDLKKKSSLSHQSEKTTNETSSDDLNSCSKKWKRSCDNNDASVPKKNPSLPSRLEGWTIQPLRDSNTTLYICNRCSDILVSESATKSHQCTSANIEHILPINDKINQKEGECEEGRRNNIRNENESITNKKKRRRVYFGGDD